MARPSFDAVTGVSTGALIAPFAFIGDEQSINHIVELYRNPRPDWFRPRALYATKGDCREGALVAALAAAMVD
jgi:hypothetical protein